MSSNRPNLILDEQAFQDLLSAAFTIQEHNARLNQARPAEIKPQIRSTAEPESFCQHCGTLKPPHESHCQRCGLEEFRPGERMQRKWASMWLMSQEQSLWPERPAGARDAEQEVHEAAAELPAPLPEMRGDLRRTDTTPELEQPALGRSNRDSDFNSLLAAPTAPETASETPKAEPVEAETIQQLFRRSSFDRPPFDRPSFDRPSVDRTPADDWGVREESATKSKRPGELRILPDLAEEIVKPEHADEPEGTLSSSSSLSLRASADPYPTEATAPEGIAAGGARFDEAVVDAPIVDDALVSGAGSDTHASSMPMSMSTSAAPSLRRRLADLRVTLRFHRANLYLGAAILLAVGALMWPTGSASAPQQATLSPMERILVAIGIAEAPAPVIHSTGDPSLNVWVDPHTALYYCPGEEQYGKTLDGRVSTQHDAQMDRFQPAGRAVCE